MLVGRLKAAVEGWIEDDAGQMGAALAYYTLFSLAPLFVLALLVLGPMFGEEETKQNIVAQVRQHFGQDSAAGVRALVDTFQNTRGWVATSVVGLVSLLYGATGMFTSLRNSLQRIWRLPPVKGGRFFRLVKTYLLAVIMTFVACTFLVVLLLVSTAMPLLSVMWAREVPSIPWSGPVVDFVASTLLLTLLFVFTFRLQSDGRVRYGHLWGGALVSALFFTAGKMVIGLYLAYANLASVYGAAGSLVVFLAWVYYSAQALFFGAEFVRGAMERAGASRFTGP